MQVAEEVAKLAFFKRGVRELPIYGGQSYQRQFRGRQSLVGLDQLPESRGRLVQHCDALFNQQLTKRRRRPGA